MIRASQEKDEGDMFFLNELENIESKHYEKL